MNKHMKQLDHLRLLKLLSHNEVLSCLQTGQFKIVSYSKDSVIHLEGDLCSKAEIIMSGKVGVFRIDEKGDTLLVSEFSSNNILGGNIIFAHFPYYQMSKIAIAPTTILEIGKEVLFDLLYSNSAFLLAFLEDVSNYAQILGSKIKNHMNKTMRERILSFLVDESKKQNSNCIKLPLTKKALAERIGVQRTSLSRELAKMKKDGLITYDADSITLECL